MSDEKAIYSDSKPTPTEQPIGDGRVAMFTRETGTMFVDNCGRNYRKSGVTKMVKMPEPFICQTPHGPVPGKKGDWMAIDVEGYPYPIDADIQEKSYVVARKSRAKA